MDKIRQYTPIFEKHPIKNIYLVNVMVCTDTLRIGIHVRSGINVWSGINVQSGINVLVGKFSKNNKHMV